MKTLITFQILLLLSLSTLAAPTFEQHQYELKLAQESIAPELPALKIPRFTLFRLNKFAHIDPKKLVNPKLLEAALNYFEANKTVFQNQDYLTVIDFSLFSGNARFSLIDMNSGEVTQFHNAHGEGSDADDDGFATNFSNVSGSRMTSLGVYKTAETYSGSYGFSMRVDGLSATNSNARKRAIVVHGADYVTETEGIQGRSWGCPAVALEHRDEIIAKIKGGSMIFAGN